MTIEQQPPLCGHPELTVAFDGKVAPTLAGIETCLVCGATRTFEGDHYGEWTSSTDLEALYGRYRGCIVTDGNLRRNIEKDRDEWDKQLTDDVAALDLTNKLRASGRPWYTADADGNVIRHEALSSAEAGFPHPFVHTTDGAAGPRATLVGTGADVWEVIATVQDNDDVVQEAADYLHLPLHLVQAAVAYYGDHADEIDAAILHNEELRSTPRCDGSCRPEEGSYTRSCPVHGVAANYDIRKHEPGEPA